MHDAVVGISMILGAALMLLVFVVFLLVADIQ